MNEQQAVEKQQGVILPTIAFPKGGGAIQGMGEALNGGGVSGSATLTLPLPVSAGRGFAPGLTLNYASTVGNSPFGLGFTLEAPSIARRTTKGVPRYQSDDTFAGPDGEWLVPEADTQGQPVKTLRHLHGQQYTVIRYYACAETAFDRLEHWMAVQSGGDFWLMLAADGTQHCFGNPATVTPGGAAAYIADPDDASRIVRWMLLESASADGQHIWYEYKAEDERNVDTSGMPEQAHRRGSQRYLKRVHYGNKEAAAGLYVLSEAGSLPDAQQWHFEVVFDYGEHTASDDSGPTYREQRDWLSRQDPFSDYAAGFEVRTHRLCRNVLMFHRFAELGDDFALVRQLQVEYDISPAGALLRGLSVIGHGIDPATGTAGVASMPPLDLAYGRFSMDESAFRPFEALNAIPRGLQGLNDGVRYQLVDLYGEGLPGVLYRDGASFWYRAPHRQIDPEDPENENAVAYSQWAPLPLAPIDRSESARPALMDLTGDGQLDWVLTQPGLAGFFTLGPDKIWQSFTPFEAFPSEFLHPQAQLADLVGAGLSDLALIGPKSVRLYANRREAGFAPPEEVPHTSADSLPTFNGLHTELVAFADVLGSGQSHLVRVRHNELVCWPNLGRGRFGTPITLATLPFDASEFNPRRVYLADLDGSGAADLIYVESDRVRIFMNQAGNGLAPPIERPWPQGERYDDECQVSFADVLGTGCAALVLTVPHMTPRHWVCEFAQNKPYLLERVNNNRGCDMQVRYRSSAQEWLDEKAATSDAVSHLPFPVQVMSQQVQTDEITGNTLTQRYRYRHGFYDGYEREFRGFGCVTQWDTEVDDAALADDTTLSAPVMTKTWFRVGAAQDEGYRDEYYAGDTQAPPLGETRVVDSAGQLIMAPDDTLLREARRALRSRVMRQEVYGVDQTSDTAHPYSVAEYRYQVRVVQDPAAARVLLPMQLEQFTAQYERVPDEPMCTHQVVLEADRYGYTTWSATVHYPRRSNPPTPDEYNDPQQAVLWITENRATTIHLDSEVDIWRLGLSCETKTAVLRPEAPPAGGWLGYEQLSAGMLDPLVPREVIAWQRHYYVDTDGNTLPLGQATPEGLLVKTLMAEVTPDTLEQACDGFLSAEAIPAWMEQAKYSFTDGYYWIASASTHYLGLADFYRPGSQTDLFGAETRLKYDASRCCVSQVTDAAGHVTQAEYDYRLLQPSRTIDPNQNKQEAAYDPLNRPRVSSFYGTQEDRDIGFAPVDTYRTSVTTLDAALTDPASAIQHTASVYYEDLSSWMGHLDEQTLTEAERAVLYTAGLITADSGIRARCRWLSAEPDGISAERWAQIRAAVEQARRTPIHAASFTHDGYPNDAERQIRYAVSFIDGFGRALQSKQRVAPGLAWTADANDNLVLEAGQPVSQQTPTRWAVSGRVEYNNKGLAVRVYQPYFIDTPRYVNDASLRQFAPHDTFYYDPLGRNTRVQTAAGHERRSRFDVWFDAHEDENDTGDDPLHQDTPTVEVRDNRGLTVREVRYNSTADDTSRQTLITRHMFDAGGALANSADPRHIAQDTVNFRYWRTLSGQLLRTDSVDAGVQCQLHDARGLITWAVTANGHRQRWTYDLLRRLTARFEQLSGTQNEVCRERLDYGTPDSDAGHNCRGRLIRHADPAGLTTIGGYSINGQPLSETRSFLATLSAPDWPKDEAAQRALLEPECYTSRWAYNALGETSTHTDAGRHRRRYEADIAGQLQAVWLQLADQDERCVASDFTYNAAGQPLQVRAGNGVMRTYTYEPRTQRLTRLCARREHDSAILQDLSYTYDPVSNITCIEDTAQPVRYTRNQRVEATSTYQYDALYQLVRATGRESAQAGRQSAALPPWQGLDDTQRVNYTRQYAYDVSGNLQQMQHTGAQHYTLRMVVAAGSNRVVPETWDVAPEQVDRYFDANGNLTQLQPGQPVDWNARDQLSRVVQVERDGGDDDDEHYAYSSQGQRAHKVRRWRAGSQQHTEDVRYLPGLERREHRQANADHLTQSNVTEALQVVVVDAGGIALRVMHWEAGKPEQIDNDQARYSLDNQLGSSTLELDDTGQLLSYEEYYPYGGTAVWAAKSELEAKYRYVRYSGKERDASGLYYYGYRYYTPWLGRWLNPDPAGTMDGLNVYRMVRNNPTTLADPDGLAPPPSKKSKIIDGIDLTPHPGSHGQRKKEQERLTAEFKVKTSGNTHESEHIIGNKELIAGRPRGIGAKSKAIEYFAPAYQEVKLAHRKHIGTGNTSKSNNPNPSNNSKAYRDAQRELFTSGEVGAAMQLNQATYADNTEFRKIRNNPQYQLANKVADNSFYHMLSHTERVAFQPAGQASEVQVASLGDSERVGVVLARSSAVTQQYPTAVELRTIMEKANIRVPSTMVSLQANLIDEQWANKRAVQIRYRSPTGKLRWRTTYMIKRYV